MKKIYMLFVLFCCLSSAQAQDQMTADEDVKREIIEEFNDEMNEAFRQYAAEVCGASSASFFTNCLNLDLELCTTSLANHSQTCSSDPTNREMIGTRQYGDLTDFGDIEICVHVNLVNDSINRGNTYDPSCVE